MKFKDREEQIGLATMEWKEKRRVDQIRDDSVEREGKRREGEER